jgi:signal peptidase II
LTALAKFASLRKQENFMQQKFCYYLLALIIISLDQYTKLLALQHLSYATPVAVFPSLNWTLLYNTGAAFSFLSEAGGWQHFLLGGLAVAVSVFIVVYIYKLPSQAILMSIALALVLGGAVGNVYDRFTLGYVVDFIDVYVDRCGFLQSWFYACHWPAFNVADSAITVGAILLIVDAVKNPAPVT